MTDLLVERLGWALRAAEGECVAARLEQGSKAHTSLGQKNKRPRMGPFTFWRCNESCSEDALVLNPPLF